MKKNNRTARIFAVVFLSMVMLFVAACGTQPAPNNTAAIQAAVAMTVQAAQCDPFDAQTGWPLASQSPDGGCNYALAATQPAGQQPTSMPPVGSTPTAQVFSAPSADTSAYEGTATCEDGKNETPYWVQTPTDIPWGTKEGATIAEIAWKPGTGFDGWYRINAIAERIIGTEMPYANDVLTLRVTQYCGSLQAIKDWAPTHVTAMVNSSQNSAGARPNTNEIPIVLLKRDGSIEWVVQVTNGPSMEEIKAHLEMRP